MGCFASKPEQHSTSEKVTNGKSRIVGSTNRLGTSEVSEINSAIPTSKTNTKTNTKNNNKPSNNTSGYKLGDSTSSEEIPKDAVSSKVAAAAEARYAKHQEQLKESKDKLKTKAKLSRSEKGL